MKPTLLVLGDQLTRQVGPLARRGPDDVQVLMIESRGILHALPHHAQKLTVFLSAMRHFAADLEADGYAVQYLRLDHPAADDFASGLQHHLDTVDADRILLQRPNDHGVHEPIEEACATLGVPLEILANELWVTPDATFDAWAETRKTLRLEHFYRTVRRETGLLMDGPDAPRGGEWNYDAENRGRPDPTRTPPTLPTFEPDALTREVQRDVAALPHAWGAVDPFGWPVTRRDALTVLQHFLDARLDDFGTFQDAMVGGQPTMWHSTLSVPLNLGLLHPREVLDATLAHAEQRERAGRPVPLNALEGFVRQILGWREFLHHVYRTRGAALRDMNELGAHADLPPAYWGAPTELACLADTLQQLEAMGYTHHIQRLMVLGNLAQLVGVNPQALLAWFTATHVDALDWVMVPNVIGMSQYADGGTLTSKPYAAGANYLNRMSDHCGPCRFDPKAKDGPDACPITSWYWSFIDRHEERFAPNPRMRMIVSAWRKRPEDDKQRVRERASQTRDAFLRGEL